MLGNMAIEAVNSYNINVTNILMTNLQVSNHLLYLSRSKNVSISNVEVSNVTQVT